MSDPSPTTAAPGQPADSVGPAAADPASGRPPVAPRSMGRRFGADMVRSLGLVALVLLGMFLLAYPRVPDPVKPLDWRPAAQSAAAAASFEVLAPPQQWPWVATSARIEPQPDGTIIWRAGFLTPEGDYAALLQRGDFPQQAGLARDQWIAEQSRDGREVGSWAGPGGTWRRLAGTPQPDEKRSLVLVDDGTVTMVTGSAPWSALEELAGRLAPIATGSG